MAENVKIWSSLNYVLPKDYYNVTYNLKTLKLYRKCVCELGL
jgi:hypothetical protein